MTREEQLRFCKVCELKSFDPKKGLICSLTDERATFEGECPDFKGDTSMIESREHQKTKAVNEKDTVQRFSELFTISESYFVTPILFHLNLLVYIVMIIAGGHFLFPSPDFLITWGANYTVSVLEGEYWRLLSNIFLHSGLLHLTMNMIALLFVGPLLEKTIGSARTLVAFLLTGIGASVVSFWWYDLIISVGASGAVFGLFGVKIATLITNPPDKEEQKRLLTTFIILVIYNLMGGFQEGIDQAAHIGGLVSGLIYGLAIYPPFIKIRWVKIVGESIVVVLLGLGIYHTVLNKPKDLLEYAKLSEKFAKSEEYALKLYKTSPDASPQSYLYTIRNIGIPNWNACKIIINKMDRLEALPPELKERNESLKEYVDLRVKSYRTIFKAIAQNTNKYDKRIEKLNQQIDSIVFQMAGNEAQSIKTGPDNIDKKILEYREKAKKKAQNEKVHIDDLTEQQLKEILKNPESEKRIIIKSFDK